MGGKRVFVYILVIVFIICALAVGAYFYITVFSKQDSGSTSGNSTSNSTAQETISAVIAGVTNGGGGSKIAGCTFGASCYPKSLGGVDDYNNGGTMPTDGYSKPWIECNEDNKYCDTNDSFAEKKDPNTGLVWTGLIKIYSTWFEANNCKYPNGLSGDDGTCDTNGEASCLCVKHTGGDDPKSGCEALGLGVWRLPFQKELMQSYIDGSYSNLTDSQVGYWSATTRSDDTATAWVVYQNYGNTSRNDKTIGVYAIRCVR